MYALIHKIFSDQTGGAVFQCFGIWHILYMLVIFCGIILAFSLLKNQKTEIRQRAVKFCSHLAFFLYILDFFLMPFAYGQIDIEKLPFHMCTAMCVLSFVSWHHPRLGGWKRTFALLGLVSNIIYVVYPAGVGWYQIHPLSYRTVQTLMFHGIMTAYGILFLAFDQDPLHWEDCRKDLLGIVVMTLWALLGNTLYNGAAGEYSHFFNWFFVVRDPFYLLPQTIAPYLMPFVMVLVIFVADLLVYSIYFIIKKRR